MHTLILVFRSTAGDYYFTMGGFLMTLLGVVLASIKTVATNRLMTGTLKLSALEVLLRMSPLAAIQCVAYGVISGEADRFRTALAEGQFSNTFGAALLLNAVTAFLLNVVGFQANKMAGALTISVCGNVKQALTILFGIVVSSPTESQGGSQPGSMLIFNSCSTSTSASRMLSACSSRSRVRRGTAE